jgi:hypothetical protein
LVEQALETAEEMVLAVARELRILAQEVAVVEQEMDPVALVVPV